MSDLMFYGVLEMPYEMAMSDEISHLQFYSRVQEAVRRLKAAEAATESAKVVQGCDLCGGTKGHWTECPAPEDKKQSSGNTGELPPSPASAAQYSAPAELHIRTWQERLREKSPETADRNLFAVGHLEHAMESEIADLRAALSRPVVAIPEGWKLVQLEPTDEMCDEVITEIGGFLPGLYESAEIYKAMLAAAPASPQPPVQRASELTDEHAAFEVLESLYCATSNVLPAESYLRAQKTGQWTPSPSYDVRGFTGTVQYRADDMQVVYAAMDQARAILAASTPTTLTEKKE